MSVYLPFELTNDWGHDTWRVGEVKLDGEHAYVAMARWPDGTEIRTIFDLRIERVSVGDMGHGYDTSTPVYYVRGTLHGAEVEICAKQLHVDPTTLRPTTLRPTGGSKLEPLLPKRRRS